MTEVPVNKMLEVNEIAPAASGLAVMLLVLPYEQRQKSRLRTVTSCGRILGLFLERGRILVDGDLLRAVDGSLIRVVAADEPLSQASSSDPLLLLRVAYHLGNRHVAVEIREGRLRWLHDHVLDDMVRQLGLEVSSVSAPFHPERGAYHSSAAPHAHVH